MSAKRSRSTDYFDQKEEGRFEPVVDTPRSRYVPIENLPSRDLNPEELCILCEELKKVTDPALREAVEELLATHSSHPVPPKGEEDGSEFPPPDSETILVAKIRESGAEVKPHRNGPSLVAASMVALLLGVGDCEFLVIGFDDEE